MRPRTHATRVALCLAAGATLTLVACGSDGGGGGGGDDEGGGNASTEAFCEKISELAEPGDATTEDEDLAAIQAVADAAPSEISSEMDDLVNGFELLRTFDVEAASEEEMADFLAIADGLDEASTKVEEFATENCPGLPADFFSTE